jgi:crotonobetainyl-CoA:carnitine CoA-transferase CaiB-like acyl-CoA transferase
MGRPLAGVRIIALEQFGAGPFGSMQLADLGAEVIKIEDPNTGGDIGRHVPPYSDDEDSLYFETFNRGKKSVTLDLAVPAGRAIFEELVAISDAVYSNLRGDVPAKIGLLYENLKHLNPAIVCCSLTGFGMSGPRQAEPGYDYIVQALTGWMDITGEPDGPPTKSGLSIVDFSTGFVAALALVCGLYSAKQTGRGADCDVSLFDTAVSMLSYPAVWHLNAGFSPQRLSHSAHPSLVPFQAFEAADGWLVIGCAKEKFWQRLTVVIERPELAGDPRFATFSARRENYHELMDVLVPLLRAQTREHWMTRLRRASIPAGEVNSVEEALRDPQIASRGLIHTANHPRYGVVRTLASPVRVGESLDAPTRSPRLGEQTEAVLRELLGYRSPAIAAAKAAGAFGAAP